MVLMLAGTIVWLVYSVFHAFITRRKDRKFSSVVDAGHSRVKVIKDKQFRNLNDQMNYVRERANVGLDFVNVALIMALYFLLFFVITLPLIKSFLVGIPISLVAAGITAYVGAKYIHPIKYYEYNLVSIFLSYLYASMFLTYIKFIITIHPLLLLASSILIMYVYARMEVKVWS